ncbi:MAG: restriction endonuclease subunit S, partial [Liquorilactobacillus satsumensis]|uniref:restriction endonuclease subunit S n=1 Tax=Liquorilactobacillus satsumensis TaxID=259059 RepID=UPI0039EAFC14
DGNWKQRKFGELLKEFSKRSTVENEYTVLSSTTLGMEIRDGRVSGVSNIGYKIIKDGDLVLSPQNLWLGNININSIGIGLVSPSYKTFQIVGVNQNFLASILKSAHMLNAYRSASTQGASVVRRNLNIAQFHEITVKIPSKREQEMIGNLFLSLTKTVAIHQQKLYELKKIKRTLLQRMLI